MNMDENNKGFKKLFNDFKDKVFVKREEVTTGVKRLIKKFNVIDFLITGLILISFIALLYKITLGNGDELKAYQFTYVCEETPLEFADTVTTGNQCADGDTGEFLGEIIGAEKIEDASAADSSDVVDTTENSDTSKESEKKAADNKNNKENNNNENNNNESNSKNNFENNPKINTAEKSPVPKTAMRIYARTNGYEAERGVAIGENVYLKGKKLNLIVGDTVYEVYISDIKLIEE